MNLLHGAVLLAISVLFCACMGDGTLFSDRPNILFAVSDDQSYPHASAYGARFVSTPVFDRIAAEGILFSNAFVASPGCAPSRASMVTGRHPWQNRHAGNHNTFFPSDIGTLSEVLGDGGYHVGFTGKGVGPFYWALAGREENPAGPEYNEKTNRPPEPHMRDTDYAANFEAFLSDRPDGMPFFFWYGASEPHRRYAYGAGLRAGKRLDQVDVPAFLPDADSVRFDMLDYAVEIEWFDAHLGRMISRLEELGELDNTVVIATSDNGMPFPAAKANVYDAGFHVPLAVRWGGIAVAGRETAELVSLMDLAPTVLDLAELPPDALNDVSGVSWRPIFDALSVETSAYERDGVYVARERHSSSRWANLGYPQRAVRTDRYLYIRNYRSERWPAGAPEKLGPDGSLVPAYHDLDWSDVSGLASRFVIRNRDASGIDEFATHALDLRPAEALFDVTIDPGCMNNLAGDPEMSAVLSRLRQLLENEQRRTGDARLVGPNPDVFESHPRLAGLRRFPLPRWTKNLSADSLDVLVAFSGSDYGPLKSPDSLWSGGVKLGKWQLQQEADGDWALYDRRRDPRLLKDLAPRMPQVVGQLRRVITESEEGGLYDVYSPGSRQ